MKREKFGQLKIGDYFTRVGWLYVSAKIQEIGSSGLLLTDEEVLPLSGWRNSTTKDDDDVIVFEDYDEAALWYESLQNAPRLY